MGETNSAVAAQSGNTTEKKVYTFYPTGIVDVERRMTLKAGERHRVTIPVKKQFVGDVAGTISILGDFIVEETPNYPVQDTNLLKLDLKNLTRSMIETLGGAVVNMTLTNNRTVTGILSGLDQNEKDHGTFKAVEYHVGVLEVGQDASAGGNIKRISLNEIVALNFVDQAIVGQIKKALQANIEKTRPNSSFIYLTVVGGNKGGSGVVQYALPSPAWKTSYRVFMTKKGTFIQGFAHVENDNEEDMQGLANFTSSRPNSMRLSQLAQIIQIQREEADLVNRNVTGSVSVDSAAGNAPGGRKTIASARAMGVASPAAAPMMASMECADSGYGSYESFDVPAVSASETTVAVTQESSTFKSDSEVSIPAGTGCAPRIFTENLNNAQTVLFFKGNGTNPFRALRFVNELGHSLPHGVYTLYENGSFIGQSLPKRTFHPNETVFLPYAEDTAVVRRIESKPPEARNSRISIKKGYSYIEQLVTGETTYTIKSVRTDSNECIIEHVKQLPQGEMSVTGGEVLETTVAGAVRIKLTVPASNETQVVITERQITEVKHFIADDFGWVQNNIIDTGNSLAGNETIRRAIQLQGQIDTLNEQIQAAQTRVNNLNSEQTRLRENLRISNSGNSDTLQKWQSRLDAAGDEVTKLEQTEIPDMHVRLSDLEAQKRETLSAITAEWSDSAATATK